jgi:hypothetical protein
MAVPVISNVIGSALAFGVGQDFVFQLAADNDPVAWRVGAGQSLPPGVVFSPISGTLSGAGVVSGIWSLTFTAINSDGESLPATFCIGVYDIGGKQDYFKKALINTSTMAVSFSDPALEVEANNVTVLAAAAGQLRYGDEVVFKLAFTNGSGTGQGASLVYNEFSPRLAMARFSMKGNETEAPFFVTSPPAFKKSVEYVAGEAVTSYYLFAYISGQALQSYLADFESDSGTFANTICELDLEFERPLGASGPLTTSVTTQPFLLRVSRDAIS